MEKVTFQNYFKIAGILEHCNYDKIVILIHGLHADKEEGGFYTKLAEKLTEIGISSFRFDFRACGESEGTWEDYDIKGMVSDLRYAIKFLKEKGYKEIGIIASSLGGSISIIYCEEETVIFLCLLNPLLNYNNLINPQNEWGKKWFKWNELEEIGYIKYKEIKLGPRFYQDIKEINLPSKLNKINCPVIIIHGNNDQKIPITDSLKYYKLFGGRSNLVTIDGADHGFNGFEDQVNKEILKFVKTAFRISFSKSAELQRKRLHPNINSK